MEAIEEPVLSINYIDANQEEKESSKSLLDKVNWLVKSISSNPVVPIIENLLFKDGFIYSTNLQVTQVIKTPIKGTFLINAKRLQKILKTLDSNDYISFGGKVKLEVFINDVKSFSFESENPSDFPKMPEKCSVTIADIKSQSVFDTITSIKKFASKDELRPAMMCVCIDDNKAVTTDGHRLVFRELNHFNLLENGPILIPQNVVDIIQKFGDAVVKRNESKKNISITTKIAQVVWATVDEVFPNYKSVIPEAKRIFISVSKNVLLKNINLAILAANGSTFKGVFALRNGQQSLILSAEDLDKLTNYSNEMPLLDYKWEPVIFKNEEGELTKKDEPQVGELFEIALNLRFLNETIKTIDSDVITFDMTYANRAVLINNEYLLMPLMLNDLD